MDEVSRIRRGRPQTRFTSISNGLIENLDLSTDARLAQAYLLSKPEDWELRPADLRRLLGRRGRPCGRNKAYGVINELRGEGYVKAVRIYEGGRFLRVDYYVFDEPLAPAERDFAGLADAADEAGDEAAVGSTGDAIGELFPQNRDTVLNPQKQDPENRDITKDGKKQTTDLVLSARAQPFDEWWALYPHKVAKAEAKRAFEKAVRKVSAQTLADGVQAYIDRKPPDRPWCNPATWLNGERWLDQPAAVATAPSKRTPGRPGDALFDLCRNELFPPNDGVSHALANRH